MTVRASSIVFLAVSVAVSLLLVTMPTHAQTSDIATLAGGGFGDGSAPTLAALVSPAGIAIDSHGNFYVADSAAHRIRKIDVQGNLISTIAGTGNPGFSGDGGPASAATLNSPFGLAVDDDDNLYVADSGNNRIRKLDIASGIITTVAGSGKSSFGGDGGPATNASFHAPKGVDVDQHENIYIADTLNNRIRKVDGVNGTVTTIAGQNAPGSAGDLELAVDASLDRPGDVAVDDLGNVYIADTGNHLIRQITDLGVMLTIAGKRDGVVDPITVAASGRALDAVLRNPMSVSLDGPGKNLYVADTGNNLVRRIALEIGIENRQITTEAGSVDGFPGYDGEKEFAVVSSLDSPSGVAINSSGEVFISDTGNRRVRATVRPGEQRAKILVTVAGNGEATFAGENTPASEAALRFPSDVAIHAEDIIYFSDTGNHRVRRVNRSTGVISTVAGTGTVGHEGLDGQGKDADLHSPEGLAFDSGGNLYIADTGNDRVLKLDVMSGVIRALTEVGWLAPNSTSTIPSFNSTSTIASFNSPTALAIDSADNLYVADTGNHRIRMVDLDTGKISTVAGDGETGFAGDGGPATLAKLNKPEGVSVDPDGNIIIADTGNRRIRRVDARAMTISTIAGDGSRAFTGDGGPATEAGLVGPRRVAWDANGNVFISDALDHRIRAIKLDGTITTVVGDGASAFDGDGGPATSASLNRPLGMALDSGGNLYFADNRNNRIRVVAAPVVEEPSPTPVPTDTPAPVPTVTPVPADTPIPTDTPAPTSTPTPEPTATPASLPDLVPEDDVQYEFAQRPVCRLSSDEPEIAPITYRIVVRNRGSADSGSFVVDANGLARATVQRLGGGASTVVEITGIRSGDNVVTVDAASEIVESNEENNTTQFKLVIPPQEPIPVCTPTPTPTHTPVPPTATPTSTPTPLPTSTPTPSPTNTPTPLPTSTPTPSPTTTTTLPASAPPTPIPTYTPTPVPPTSTPTLPPTYTPTAVPTNTPTAAPTNTATPMPPTATPTVAPIVVIVTATPVVEVTPGDDEGPNIGLLIAIPIVVLLSIGMLAGLYVAYRRRTFGQ